MLAALAEALTPAEPLAAEAEVEELEDPPEHPVIVMASGHQRWRPIAASLHYSRRCLSERRRCLWDRS